MDRAQVDVELIRALDDDVAEVRAAAAQALSDRKSTPLGLVDVLSSGSNRAQDAALIALRGHGPDVRQAVIAWTLGRLESATELRRARAMLADSEPGGPPPEPALAFLLAVLSRREAHTIGLALRALVVLGVPDAGGVIRRCLHSDDVGSGRRRSRRSTLSVTASSRRPSSGSSKTRRSMCGIAMPRLPGWSMMTTRGSAAWHGGYGQERTRCRTRVGPSAISRR